jgi:pimeloyl-ACP methyl ester carboxylesterase
LSACAGEIHSGDARFEVAATEERNPDRGRVPTSKGEPALDYDEFGFLQEYAGERRHRLAGADRRPPNVRRRRARARARCSGETPPRRSSTCTGEGRTPTPGIQWRWRSVLRHWRVDLPGHGHSSWREDHDYSPVENANCGAGGATVRSWTAPAVVVGMSMGGLTAIHLAAASPELVAALVIVDITPGMPGRQELGPADRGAAALLGGPTEFASFEEMLASVRGLLPERADTGLYGGVRHNSRRLEDGTWTWRYDPIRGQGGRGINRDALWEDFSSLTAPTMLVRGGDSRFTQDVDIAEVQRRKPSTRIEVVSWRRPLRAGCPARRLGAPNRGFRRITP